jgi:hypothetical protein
MIFYLVHHVNQYLIPWPKGTTEGRKNVFTFIIGCMLYFVLFGYLIDPKRASFVEGNSFLLVLRDFFKWVIACDVLAVACLFKLHFKRSITTEIKDVFGDGKGENKVEDGKFIKLIDDINAPEADGDSYVEFDG